MDNGQPARNLAELVEQHYGVLYRYCYRLSGTEADAEDLVQQTFLTAQAKIDQLQNPEYARSWLFTIARNGFLKSRRGKRGAGFVPLESAPEPTEECNLETKIEQEFLQDVLNELDDEFRIPLILFYFEQFSYKDIARQMDVPIGTVMSRLARGKAHLRQRLAAFEPAGERR